MKTDEHRATVTPLSPRGPLLIGLLSVFAAVLFFTAALAGLAPSASASAQSAGATIAPAFPFGEPRPPAITATAAILIDMDSGRILYSRNANARVPMASTTKIMTAIIALESLELGATVTISADVAATGGSRLWLEEGEVLTVEQLMYALLVSSANDAAVALAEAVSGSVQTFVKQMNEKAEALGLANTHFVNPHGLNAKKHFSSARDLAILAQYAMQDPVFRQMVHTREYTIPWPGHDTPRQLENHNVLLGRQAWVTGVKTGSTPYAKYCLVASGTRDGVSLVSVVLGATNEDVRWRETEALLDYGFSLYPRTVLADKGGIVAELDVSDRLDRRVSLVADRSLTVSLFKTDAVTSSVRVDRDPVLPVHAGDVFGAIDFTLNGKSLGSVSLVAAQSVDKVTIKMILECWRDLWPPKLGLGDYLRALPPH
ncbi:MAG: D-alanyl-D-alanine carboxypeptidase family protein [bacterium]